MLCCARFGPKGDGSENIVDDRRHLRHPVQWVFPIPTAAGGTGCHVGGKHRSSLLRYLQHTTGGERLQASTWTKAWTVQAECVPLDAGEIREVALMAKDDAQYPVSSSEFSGVLGSSREFSRMRSIFETLLHHESCSLLELSRLLSTFAIELMYRPSYAHGVKQAAPVAPTLQPVPRTVGLWGNPPYEVSQPCASEACIRATTPRSPISIYCSSLSINPIDQSYRSILSINPIDQSRASCGTWSAYCGRRC